MQHNYDEDQAADGYVAHFTQAWCWRPDVFGKFPDMRVTLLRGTSLSVREIAVVVATTVSGRRTRRP